MKNWNSSRGDEICRDFAVENLTLSTHKAKKAKSLHLVSSQTNTKAPLSQKQGLYREISK
jgi:hypothetical protein